MPNQCWHIFNGILWHSYSWQNYIKPSGYQSIKWNKQIIPLEPKLPRNLWTQSVCSAIIWFVGLRPASSPCWDFIPKARSLVTAFYQGDSWNKCRASTRVWSPKVQPRCEWPGLIRLITRLNGDCKCMKIAIEFDFHSVKYFATQMTNSRERYNCSTNHYDDKPNCCNDISRWDSSTCKEMRLVTCRWDSNYPLSLGYCVCWMTVRI